MGKRHISSYWAVETIMCFSTRVFLPQAHPISGRCRFFTIWIEGIAMGWAHSDLPFQRTFVYADLFLILFFLPEKHAWQGCARTHHLYECAQMCRIVLSKSFQNNNKKKFAGRNNYIRCFVWSYCSHCWRVIFVNGVVVIPAGLLKDSLDLPEIQHLKIF